MGHKSLGFVFFFFKIMVTDSILREDTKILFWCVELKCWHSKLVTVQLVYQALTINAYQCSLWIQQFSLPLYLAACTVADEHGAQRYKVQNKIKLYIKIH